MAETLERRLSWKENAASAGSILLLGAILGAGIYARWPLEWKLHSRTLYGTQQSLGVECYHATTFMNEYKKIVLTYGGKPILEAADENRNGTIEEEEITVYDTAAVPLQDIFARQ